MKPRPMAATALLAKINRKLAARGEQVQKTGRRDQASLGALVLMDTRRNSILETSVDLARIAKNLGIIGQRDRIANG